jgi:hypothetical protein
MEQKNDEFTAALIKATAEATAEALIRRMASMVMNVDNHKERIAAHRLAAQAMRAKGATFAEIGIRLGIDRSTAFQYAKPQNNQV